MVDFWRMILQVHPPTIVMVTNVKENNRVKCHQYWPDTGSRTFGPFRVTIINQQIFTDYIIRRLQVEVSSLLFRVTCYIVITYVSSQLTGSSECSHLVTHYHFTSWPDHGVPEYATPILAFHRRIKREHKPSQGPMVVHCRYV